MISSARAVILCVLCAGISVCAFVGCHRGGPTRYPVKGKVTFKGQPVQAGAVFFEPTLSAGKEAPTVYLRLENGEYQVSRDKGPGAGKYTVVVGGWDKAREFVDDDGITHSFPLFKDYRFEVEFPVPNNTLDIEVPESQAVE